MIDWFKPGCAAALYFSGDPAAGTTALTSFDLLCADEARGIVDVDGDRVAAVVAAELEVLGRRALKNAVLRRACDPDPGRLRDGHGPAGHHACGASKARSRRRTATTAPSRVELETSKDEASSHGTDFHTQARPATLLMNCCCSKRRRRSQ